MEQIKFKDTLENLESSFRPVDTVMTGEINLKEELSRYIVLKPLRETKIAAIRLRKGNKLKELMGLDINFNTILDVIGDDIDYQIRTTEDMSDELIIFLSNGLAIKNVNLKIGKAEFFMYPYTIEDMEIEILRRRVKLSIIDKMKLFLKKYIIGAML